MPGEEPDMALGEGRRWILRCEVVERLPCSLMWPVWGDWDSVECKQRGEEILVYLFVCVSLEIAHLLQFASGVTKACTRHARIPSRFRLSWLRPDLNLALCKHPFSCSGISLSHREENMECLLHGIWVCAVRFHPK